MRKLKFLAGIGTVFIFIGVFCFKAAFQKIIVSNHSTTKKPKKALLIVLGTISILAGVLFLVFAIREIN